MIVGRIEIHDGAGSADGAQKLVHCSWLALDVQRLDGRRYTLPSQYVLLPAPGLPRTSCAKGIRAGLPASLANTRIVLDVLEDRMWQYERLKRDRRLVLAGDASGASRPLWGNRTPAGHPIKFLPLQDDSL